MAIDMNKYLKGFGESIDYFQISEQIVDLDLHERSAIEIFIVEKQIQFWNQLSDYYLHRHLHVPFVRAHWRKIMKFSDILAGDKIVDLACGTGRLLENLKLQDKDFKSFIGIDYASVMIEAASKNFGYDDRVVFLKSDLAKPLPLRGESINKCISNWGVTYLPKILLQQAFQEVFRLLKPGGIFICSSVIKESRMSSRFRKVLAIAEIIISNKWLLVKEAANFEKRLRMLFPLYSVPELEEMILQAGLKIRTTEYTVAGGTVIFLAQKL